MEVEDQPSLTQTDSPSPEEVEDNWFDTIWGDFLLEDAVMKNDVQFVNDAIRSGMNVEDRAVKDALCTAAREGYTCIVSTLVEAGCKANIPDISDQFWRRTPLHLAASKGHLDTVRVLVQHGVDVDISDNEERTPLHWAAMEGHMPVVHFLLDEGASVNAVQADGFTVLHGATWLGGYKMCKFLIEQGAEVNRADIVDGMFPIHTAACNCEPKMVSLFLTAGASVNAQTSCLETPLHLAVMAQNAKVIDLLLESGADLEAQDDKGQTPLFIAVFSNFFTMCECFINHDANLNAVNTDGKSIFFVAVRTRCAGLIRLMIESGCDLQSQGWIRTKDWPFTSSSNPELCSWIHHTACNPLSLQLQCRIALRKLLGLNRKSKVMELPIPPSLQEYVGT